MGGSASGNGETTAAPKPSVSPKPSATPEPTAVPSPTATPEHAGGGTPTPEHDAVPASAPAEEGGGVSLVWIAVPVVLLVLFLIFLFRRTNREEWFSGERPPMPGPSAPAKGAWTPDTPSHAGRPDWQPGRSGLPVLIECLSGKEIKPRLCWGE